MTADFQDYARTFPVSGAALDAIKLVAALAMLLDHVNYVFLGSASTVMGLFGRASFPLFCYATATALVRDVRIKRYAIMLLVLAIPSQIAFYFALEKLYANVLFTLLAGVFMSLWLEKQSAGMRGFMFALAALLTFTPNFIDFGITGIFIPAAMYLALKGDKKAYGWLGVLLFVVNITPGDDFGALTYWAAILIIGLATVFIPWICVRLARRITSPDRAIPKYFLHVFYPAHLAVIALIRLFG